ncbi:magnesium transporter CorA family protein [Oleisolibacter albus]|uniref:magnesium transporter CorA family protein n=1 Tax=Oleisolibacter albus TaxID=2171757 RepID=UPI000DF4B7BA|nr:magnesium transporter CorA family protein [Oleisolibacter albus]
MITAYVRDGEGLQARLLEPGAALPPGTVWLDVLRPGPEERGLTERLLGLELPTEEDMSEIEASSRLYVEGDCAFLTTPVISRGDNGRLDLGLLTFVLTPGVLVTLRNTEPLWLSIFAARALRSPALVTTALEAMLGLLEAVVDRAADVLEMVGGDLDELSSRVFAEAKEHELRTDDRAGDGARRRRIVQRAVTGSPKPVADSLKAVITGVGRAGDLTQKVRACLAGLERLCAFALTVVGARMNKDQKVRLKTIARDVHSLVEHAGFQAMQTNFLLDATLGVIDIQQTNIIKIFSVAAVVFLPPTLVASIYGMNFHHQPELDWSFGYPLALLLMLLSAVLPLVYFRRRGWL